MGKPPVAEHRKIGTAPRATGRWVIRVGLVVLVLAGANAGVYWFLKTRSVPYRVKKLEEEAQLYTRVGKLEEAARAVEEAVKLQPENGPLAIELASRLAALRRPEQAEAVLRAAHGRAPEDLRVLVALAAEVLARGQAAEANALLEPAIERIRAMRDAGERSRALIVAARARARAGQAAKAKPLFEEAALGAERGPALTALGEALAAAGDAAGAEDALRKAALDSPEAPEPVLALARLLEGAGRPSEAIATLEAFLHGKAERRFEAAPPLADMLLRARRTDDARALAAELEKERTAALAAAYVRAALAAAQGDDEDALAQYGRIAQLIPRAGWPHVLAARVELRRGALDRARASFEAALAAEPGLADAELGLLELDERAGRADEVRARAERLLEAPETRARAVRAILTAYAREGDARAGLARLEELSKRFPAEKSLRVSGAIFRVLAGDAERGIAELEKLAEEDPDLPGAFALLASAQERSTDALEAIEQLGAIAAKDPRFAAARLVLAGIYDRIGRPDLAIREADAALRDRPELKQARLLRAQLAARAGDLPRAIGEVEKLCRAEPRDLGLINTLADLKLAAGDRGGTLALLEEARKLAPQSAIAAARLARAQALAGDADGALASFEAARTLDPRLPPANEDGALLLARGDVMAAQAALRRALQATGDLRFGAALAAALAIGGEPVKAVDPLLAWRARAGAAPEGAIAEAMVLALGGDRQRAQAIAALAAAPAAVKAAAVAVQAGAGNALDARTRVELEIFALGVLGWGPEVEARVERIAREPSSDALLVWWALRGLGGRGDAALRLTLSRRLAALASTDVGVALDLSAALHNAGDDQAALSTLRDLAERYPESPEVALRLGMALEQGGDLAAAREQYARAASVNRPSPIALNNLAYLLAGDAARRPLAIAHARRAVALAPRSGDLLDTLGWLLYLEGQVEEAATVLARAAAALPAQPTIRYHLALALDAQGEAARAANHLDIALLSSAARFPEREAAKALLERLRAETKLIDQAALAGGDAPSLAPGAALDGKTGTDGLAVLKLAPGAAKEARLRFAAPADGPAEATILDGRKTWKHVAAPAGDEAAIARLALPAGDAGRIVVSAAPGKSFRIELGAPAAAGEAEVEPNERPQDAAALAPGSSLAGLFDGPADRDHVRLDIPPGKRASLAIAAGPRAELRIDVLAVAGSSERLAKSARLRAGEEAAIAVLAAPARGALVLRFAAGSSIAAQAAPFDWRARLDDAAPAAAGDAEPDDRIDDALALSPGTPAAGALGPLDAIDLYRIAAPPAETVAITLRDTTAGRAAGAASPLVLELWERTGDRTLPLRRYPLASGELSLARWRTPRAGDLFLAVGLAEGSRAATSYEVSVARAEPPAGAVETEPNDRPALADTVPAGTPLRASLDAPGDQDWVRVPVLGPGVPLALSLSGPAAMRGVVVSVISHPDTDARPVAVFDATGGALVVPAIRLPDGPAAVVVAATAGAAGAYELTLGPGPTAPEVEAEPDDDAANAIVLAPGRAVRGRVSGRADRDIFAVEGGRGVTVRATGAAPIAVLAQRDGATAQVVLPGKSVTLPADAIAGKGERAFVAIFAPREEGAAGEAASTAAAQAEASYEIREGEGGR